MILVDGNVLLDVVTDDAQWRPWSEAALSDAVRTALRWPKFIAPAGFLNWCACASIWRPANDSGCEARPDLFPDVPLIAPC